MKNTKTPRQPEIPTPKSWLEQSIHDALEQMKQSASECRNHQNRLSAFSHEIQSSKHQTKALSERLASLESNHQSMEKRLSALEAKCNELMMTLPKLEDVLQKFVADLKDGSA